MTKITMTPNNVFSHNSNFNTTTTNDKQPWRKSARLLTNDSYLAPGTVSWHQARSLNPALSKAANKEAPFEQQSAAFLPCCQPRGAYILAVAMAGTSSTLPAVRPALELPITPLVLPAVTTPQEVAFDEEEEVVVEVTVRGQGRNAHKPGSSGGHKKGKLRRLTGRAVTAITVVASACLLVKRVGGI
eukprot:gene1298-1639_t